jgi:hypothetical protein
VLSQPADDVLDIDNGVVNHSPESDHQPSQGHGVDRCPLPIEHEHGRHQRERDGQQADQRDAPLEKEQPEDHDHKQESEYEGFGQVVDRQLHEVRLLEDLRVESDVRQPRLELLDGVLNAASQLECVG